MGKRQRRRLDIDVPALVDELGIEGSIRGDVLRGLCQSGYHKEKTPSWSIKLRGDRAGSHHCFGCHFGGGPVQLVAAVKAVDKKAAWQWLASFCGFSVASGARPTWSRKLPDSKARQLRYPKGTSALWKDPPEELRPAVDYLLGRGFLERELEHYAVGAVPTEVVGYGGRVIVPVVVGGVMVDFVARLFVKKELASKALSARREEGARKEYSLWGYDDLDPLLDTVVVVEGVWGRIALKRAGIPNVVASCGSSWSPERTELLEPWPRIVLMPDGDPAGSKLVGHASALRFDHDLEVVTLPAGVQPDDMSAEEIVSNLAAAKPAAFHDFPEIGFRGWTGKGSRR